MSSGKLFNTGCLSLIHGRTTISAADCDTRRLPIPSVVEQLEFYEEAWGELDLSIQQEGLYDPPWLQLLNLFVFEKSLCIQEAGAIRCICTEETHWEKCHRIITHTK